jgi:hypothetical protein
MDIIFNYLKSKIIDGAGAVLSMMSKGSIELLDNEVVTNVLSLFEHIGWIILIIGILFAIANLYISYLESESVDVHLFIVNLVESFIAIFFLKVGAIAIFKLGVTVNELIRGVTSAPDYAKSINDFTGFLADACGLTTIWVLIIGVIAIVIIIVNLLQVLKRTGMYIAQIVMGYIYLFSLPGGNTGEFIEWCKQTVAIALTNVLQTSLVFIGLNLMAKDSGTVVIGFGILFSASAVETVAGKYGLSTNISRGLKGNLKSTGTALTRLAFKG